MVTVSDDSNHNFVIILSYGRNSDINYISHWLTLKQLQLIVYLHIETKLMDAGQWNLQGLVLKNEFSKFSPKHNCLPSCWKACGSILVSLKRSLHIQKTAGNAEARGKLTTLGFLPSANKAAWSSCTISVSHCWRMNTLGLYALHGNLGNFPYHFHIGIWSCIHGIQYGVILT